ncbi:MAG: MBOAT family protein [Firmicutes bacterium HGW-Firmicutes-10]|nr:MAG: MBOAT family protein [Firmicutes bacterium HGW-Firmicutes-10]
MVFSSPVFIFIFLPIVYLANLIIPKRFSNGFLLFFSLIFYAWGEPLYVFLMIFSAFVNYVLTLWIAKETNWRKIVLIGSIIFNLSIIGVFKYADFLILSVNSLFSTTLPLLNLPLPIGISFFTFQTMSYVFDVYKKETTVQRNYFSLLFYITFFPQLIAGPIVQYHDIASQIESRTVTLDKTSEGLRRFVIGMSKKVLLANAMAIIVDRLYTLPNSQISITVAWIAAIAYLFQIYFDFSGYSDMAIGMGKMFGFHFKENFNYPYIATSMQDFWRRWHISLSSWFRLYLYIPLGGSRKGKSRAMFNRIIVFFLTGLWHGASWTFVIWGLYHGIFLLMEQTFLKVERWPNFVRRAYMLLVVLIGFVIFRAENFTQALIFIKALVTFSLPGAMALKELMILITPLTVGLFVISAIASTPIMKIVKQKTQSTVTSTLSYGFTFALWIACLLSLAANTYNPFIYFRF